MVTSNPFLQHERACPDDLVTRGAVQFYAVRFEGVRAHHRSIQVGEVEGQGLVGPCGAIAQALTVEKTLVGADVVRDGQLVAKDVTQAQLLNLPDTVPARIIVTPIGGQGFLFGRGNQQIGPEVIRRVGRENIIVVSTSDKLRALRLQPLLVDTGDAAVDARLAGYFSVVTGYKERMVYKVVS